MSYPACVIAMLMTLACMMAAANALTQPVPAVRLVSTTEAVAGSTITAFGPVFFDGAGRPASVLTLAHAQRPVWWGGTVICASAPWPLRRDRYGRRFAQA